MLLICFIKKNGSDMHSLKSKFTAFEERLNKDAAKQFTKGVFIWSLFCAGAVIMSYLLFLPVSL